jgi:hypothetical protein
MLDSSVSSPTDPIREAAVNESIEAVQCGCEAPIRFAGAPLGPQRHICAFFHSPEEEYEVLAPFIKEGFERGEKAFHGVDPKQRDPHIRRLESHGIDVHAARRQGQFAFYDWEEAYLPGGHFDQDRMLAMWTGALDDAVEKGFPRTRLVAHVECCLEDREGVSDLLEYEARFNMLPHGDRDPVVCSYDLSRYSGAFIIDVTRTHRRRAVAGQPVLHASGRVHSRAACARKGKTPPT